MELKEVEMPDKTAFASCGNPQHWFEVVTNEFCHTCFRGRRASEEMKAEMEAKKEFSDMSGATPDIDR